MEPLDRLMGVHIRKVQETVATQRDTNLAAGLAIRCVPLRPRGGGKPKLVQAVASCSSIAPRALSHSNSSPPYQPSLLSHVDLNLDVHLRYLLS